MKELNFFEKRALDYIYCSNYIPEIDDKLNCYELHQSKLFFPTIFDCIILPIGLLSLKKNLKMEPKKKKNNLLDNYTEEEIQEAELEFLEEE